jgi:hypothetical protein
VYRCRTYYGYYTLLTGTVFKKTRRRPATLVLLLRAIAKGEPTARFARELGLPRKQHHTLRQRIQANLIETAPTAAICGTAFKVDELYQNAGEKSTPHCDPSDPPCRRANQRKGHGTYANDRPPIISVTSRKTGEHRFWVCDHAHTRTCTALIAANILASGATLYTDEWPSYRGSYPFPARAMACGSAHGIMMTMAGMRCTATPVKGAAQSFGHTCAPSAANESHPR